MEKNLSKAGLIAAALLLCVSSCIILPRKVSYQTYSNVFQDEPAKVMETVKKVLVEDGFKIMSFSANTGTLTAKKTGKVAGDTFSFDTPKATVMGIAMVIDTLTIEARGTRAAAGKTNLSITIDCGAEYAKKIVDSIFDKVGTGLLLKR